MKSALIFLMAMIPSMLSAASLNSWVETSYKDFENGKMTNCLISDRGFIEGGPRLEKIELNLDSITSTFAKSKNKYYIGSKNKIYKLENDKLQQQPLFEKMGTIFNSFIEVGDSIYVSSSPNGEIFKITQDDKVKSFSKLPCQSVWEMIERDGLIYAVCGEDGKLFEIKEGGSFLTVFNAKESNITVLAKDNNGNIILGTYPTGTIYSIDNKKNIRVLIQLEENEIMGLSVNKDTIFIGANRYKSDVSKQGDEKEKSNITTNAEKSLVKTPESFALYALDKTGKSELILLGDKEYITDVKVENNRDIYVATGPRGRIYKVNFFSKNQEASYLSVDEETVTNINLSNNEIISFSTGNLGNLYKWIKDKENCEYISQVLDTENNSRWGKIYRDGGNNVTIQTRSGNTVDPDDFWSGWSDKIKAKEGTIESPRGRFIQYLANIPLDEKLDSLNLFFMGENRKPVLGKIYTTYDNIGKEELEKKNSKEKINELSQFPIVTIQNSFNQLKEHQNYLKIIWDGYDPDQDQLTYQLFYKTLDETYWKKITKEPIKDLSYSWRTDLLPDGYYKIRIVASDLRNNTNQNYLTCEGISDEFLIDNSKPQMKNLVYKDGILEGNCHDSFSPIIRIEYSINGGKWRILLPEDGIADSTTENFRFNIGKLSMNEASIAVRAFDLNWNLGVEKIKVANRKIE